MGAVLAMKMRLAGLGMIVAALAGCGSESTQLTQAARTFVSGLLQPQPEPTPLRDRLTPQALAEFGQPLMIVELLENNAEAGTQLLRSTGDLETWAALNGIHFTLRDGVLMSTRGLSGDLMSSNLDQVLPAMRAGGRGAVRVNRYLDGEDQIVARAYVCDYTRAGRERITVVTGTYTANRIDETCVSSTETVENQYWFDLSGKMRKSRQWIGPFAGYVAFERIND
jgi:hypothetical protein